MIPRVIVNEGLEGARRERMGRGASGADEGVGCRRVERGRVDVKAWYERVCESVSVSVSGMNA